MPVIPRASRVILGVAARKRNAILPPVLPRLRQFVALMLCASVFLAGSGYSGAFAAALEHDLETRHALSGPSGGASQDLACAHGCAAHMGVHLLSLPAEMGSQQSHAAATVLPAFRPSADAGVQQSSFFRPPRISLA